MQTKKPYMKSNPRQVAKHALNFSKGKAQYTIPKDKRFDNQFAYNNQRSACS